MRTLSYENTVTTVLSTKSLLGSVMGVLSIFRFSPKHTLFYVLNSVAGTRLECL